MRGHVRLFHCGGWYVGVSLCFLSITGLEPSIASSCEVKTATKETVQKRVTKEGIVIIL